MSLRLDLRLFLQRTLPILAVALLIIVPALSNAQSSSSPALPGTGQDLKGTVDKRPDGPTLTGDWSIAGQPISVTNQTTFLGFGSAGPQVGACVEVSLTNSTSTPRVAVSITPDNDCTATGAPTRQEEKGKITAQPAQSGNGTWTIGVKQFEISDATFFEGFGSTRPTLQACVEVSYALQSGKNVALRIRPEDTCSGAANDHSFRGPVDSRPSVNVGDWVIGGQAFSVTAATTFDAAFSAGQPATGDCVGLTYSESGTIRTVLTIAPANCAGDPPAKGIFEAHGIVAAPVPVGTPPFGTWTIGTVTYDARAAVVGPSPIPATTFDEKYGKLDAGVCVQVHYRLDGPTRVAVRIETEPSFRCTSSAEEHEIYGPIKKLPGTTGQLGPWSIGDLAQVVIVTPETKLSGAPFAVGQQVAVKFGRAGDGTLLAISIKLKRSPESEKEDKGRGKAYGVITATPSTPATGTWEISGTSYINTAKTKVEAGYTPAVGDCVEVYFQADATTGARTAVKISHESASACLDRVYGSVTAAPTTAGYVGSWTVGGVVYNATANTVFKTDHGALAVGAFVEVRYTKLPDGSLEAQQISTIVPPGTGDNDRTGKLESSISTAAVSLTSVTIGGVTYQVDPGTLISETQGALQNGATVQVNAYTNTSGTLVATQLSTVTTSYLPLVIR
jgi:hypothetical protein